jgi:hypothetical protein
MKDFQGNYICCKAEEKICYTKREAGIAINSAKKHYYSNERKRGKIIPKRKYFCKDCGFYHLSHWSYFVGDKISYNERKFYARYTLTQARINQNEKDCICNTPFEGKY